MYSFTSFQIIESAKRVAGVAAHTKLEDGKEDAIGHATHAADYALHSTKHRDMAISMMHNINNNKRDDDHLSRKIDGAISVTGTETKRGAREHSYKSKAAKNFKERDVAGLRATHGEGGTHPKPHVAKALEPLVRGRKRIADVPRNHQMDLLRPTDKGALGGNIVSYHPKDPHAGKELTKVPVDISHEESDIHPKHRAEIQAHLDKAKQLSKGHGDSHLVDKNGERHEHLREGKLDRLENYMNSTLDTGKKANVEDYKAHIKSKYKSKTKAAAAIAHVDKHADKFKRTFEIHHHMQQAQNKLAVAIGAKSKKVGRFRFSMSMTHPKHGELPTSTGEGFMIKRKHQGKKFLAKIVGRNANGTNPPPHHNFAYANRHAVRNF